MSPVAGQKIGDVQQEEATGMPMQQIATGTLSGADVIAMEEDIIQDIEKQKEADTRMQQAEMERQNSQA